jgi:MFS transporter, FSR family, fosmidomycin resistance protein
MNRAQSHVMNGGVTNRDARVSTLIGIGHFLSHFYVLCLPPLFLAWQPAFHVSFAQLGLIAAVMSAVTAVLQTPVGFLVDRHGARPYLVGGVALMAAAIALMGLATAYWPLLALAALSGVGNSVVHPADYAILSGSISRERTGRAFALHTFAGNLGFSVAPPVMAGLIWTIGWRWGVGLVGGIGLPLVLAVLWQSRILTDGFYKTRERAPAVAGHKLLLTRTMLLFLGFFVTGSMAGAGLQSWLITVLHKEHGVGIAAASTVLTFYMTGATLGVLVGGAVVDRTPRHLAFTTIVVSLSALFTLIGGYLPLPDIVVAVVMFIAGLAAGCSRTPRDMMVREASPPGQVGKVFGFVSSGLPLGSALTPVPFGFLIDRGHPELVFALVAGLLMLSLFCVALARASVPRGIAVPAE